MEWSEFVADTFGQTQRALERTLEGLTQDDLNQQPKPECNSIGWVVWHLTRAQDGIISALKGDEQLWISDKWHAKFNRPADPQDNGGGNTPEEVAAFKSPDVETLMGYNRAVLEKARSYITGLSAADLDREIKDPRAPMPMKVGMMLGMVISEGLQHAGHVGYIRGYFKGPMPMPPRR